MAFPNLKKISFDLTAEGDWNFRGNLTRNSTDLQQQVLVTFAGMGGLEEFDFNVDRPTNLQAFFSKLESHRTLRILKLPRLLWLTESSLRFVARMLEHDSSPEELVFSPILGVSLTPIVHALQNNTSLRKLDLTFDGNGDCTTEQDVMSFVSLLETENHTLEEITNLSIGNASLPQDNNTLWAIHIADFLLRHRRRKCGDQDVWATIPMLAQEDTSVICHHLSRKPSLLVAFVCPDKKGHSSG